MEAGSSYLAAFCILTSLCPPVNCVEATYIQLHSILTSISIYL